MGSIEIVSVWPSSHSGFRNRGVSTFGRFSSPEFVCGRIAPYGTMGSENLRSRAVIPCTSNGEQSGEELEHRATGECGSDRDSITSGFRAGSVSAFLDFFAPCVPRELRPRPAATGSRIAASGVGFGYRWLWARMGCSPTRAAIPTGGDRTIPLSLTEIPIAKGPARSDGSGRSNQPWVRASDAR